MLNPVRCCALSRVLTVVAFKGIVRNQNAHRLSLQNSRKLGLPQCLY
jgi:hypothetical protein